MRTGGRALAIVCFALALIAVAFPASADDPHVDVLRVQGVINPVSANYMLRGIGAGESDGAAAVVIQLDTPGGLDTSMREIVQRILASSVPVVVYVAPPGGRAASAGLFITSAAHVAAMAPNTTTGAAHPVQMGDNSGDQLKGPMLEKVTNDAVGYIRGLADRRGHNADWVEKAVRESVVVTGDEAVKLRVVDLVAPDLTSLLDQIDGRTVETTRGAVTLATRGAEIRPVDMDVFERVLYTISDPTIAYILLSLAMTALFLELSNPGAILPGIVGGICLLLALFALGMLPINFVGVGLILFAFLLFFAEVKVQSHGMLTVGGIVALALGSLLLINSSAPYFEISRPVIATVVLAIAAFFTFVVGKAIRAQFRQPATGREGMIGRFAEVRIPLDPKGTVHVEGELWEAVVPEGHADVGELVRVIAVDGLLLYVERLPAGLAWPYRPPELPRPRPELPPVTQRANDA